MNDSENKILGELKSWLENLGSRKLTDWEDIPDIELYMDQVVGYIDRQLAYIKSDEEKTLTPAMVNNYVKLGTLPKPEGKKYGKAHIARLFPLCVLKQILPLPVIAAAIDDFTRMIGGGQAFDRYSDIQNAALAGAAGAALSAYTEGESIDTLEVCAFELAIQAAANRIVAEKILAAAEKLKKSERAAAKERAKQDKERQKQEKERQKEQAEKLKKDKEKEKQPE